MALVLWHLNSTSSSCVTRCNMRSHRADTQFQVLCPQDFKSTILVNTKRLKIFSRSWCALLELTFRNGAIVILYLEKWSRQKTVVTTLQLNVWPANSKWHLNSFANLTQELAAQHIQESAARLWVQNVWHALKELQKTLTVPITQRSAHLLNLLQLLVVWQWSQVVLHAPRASVLMNTAAGTQDIWVVQENPGFVAKRWPHSVLLVLTG